MILANRARLYGAKQLKSHRQQHPARFERVIEVDDVYSRYYSDEPAILFGEYVLNQLKAQGDPTGRFVFAQQLDESTWFFASFEDGQLERENIGLLDVLSHQFAYELREAERIIATDKAFHGLFSDDRILLIESIPFDALDEHTLKARNKLPEKKIIGAMIAVVLLSVGVGIGLYPKPKPVITAPVDDAKSRYSQTHLSHSYASDALLSGLNLLLDASLMPSGMMAEKVTLNGQTLAMVVTEDNIAPSLKKAWIESMPTLSKHYQGNEITLTLPSPKPWQAYAVKGYSEQLQDALFYLGGTLTQTSEQRIDEARIRAYQLNFQGEAGQIPLIAELLNVPFVSVSFLEMEITDSYQITTLNMTLDIQGDSL